MTECRPPKNTPDGTVCNLAHKYSGKLWQMRWRSGSWRKPFFGTYSPEEMERFGYCFHSIAEVPE